MLPQRMGEDVSGDDTLVGGDGGRRVRDGGPLTKGATVGRYVVLEPLGTGGMGVVYAALDPELDRRVALKLLRSDPGGGSGSWGGPERLLREAQAMARLNHPNVIAVHDVGTYQGEVFVAMELVDGQTLSQWRATRRRSWREVLRVFRDAGAGLAAAHRAGIVHRDFKPDNVMISHDGRVYVLDFGLARPHGPAPEPSTDELHRTEDDGTAIPVDTRLTQTGALLGTPAYMAPEQHSGAGATAASDQFAFCVALYEALYADRPFRGETAASLAFNVLHGRVQDAPADARVPRWLRRAVVRGLRTEPSERWPAMDVLLRELAKDPGAKAGRLAGALGVALLVGAGAYAYGSRAAPRETVEICQAGDERLAGIWDDDVRNAAERAFAATGQPYAAEAWDRTRIAVDAYADAWRSGYTEACEATHVRGEQSDRMLDMRMSCLDQRRHQLGTVGELFATADEQVLQRAHQIVAGLPALAACADIEQLAAGADPPEAAVREQVDGVRETLGEIAALVDAGRYEQALGLAKPAVEAALATGYVPLEAEAKFWLGYVLEKTGDPNGAVEPLSQAAFAAQASRHDAIAARAMTVLVFVVGDRLARTDEGLDWARHARALVSRLGDPLAEAELLNDEGTVLVTAGRYPEAQERFEQALARREEALGPEHFLVGRVLNNLGTALDHQGRFEEARRAYERALAVAKSTVGPGHPELGIRLANFGELLNRMGDSKTARAQLEQAREIFEHTVGKRHHYYATATNNLATVAVSEGALEEALGLMAESKGIWIELMGPDHPDVALCELNIGSIAAKLQWHDEAMVHLEVALRIYRTAHGPDHPDVASVLISLATVLGEVGDHGRALEHSKEAVAILEKHVGPDHPELGSAYKGLGSSLLALGRLGEAVAPLKRAIEISQANDASPEALAELREALARAEK